MLQIATTQNLSVSHLDQRGAWLAAGDSLVLLPRPEVPSGCVVGERLEVFVYGVVDDQALATLRKPRAELGEFALFPVSQVNEHGVFLDWGIGKELLVPRSKRPRHLASGESCLARVELDRQGRPFANARIEQCLIEPVKGLKAGDAVHLLVWQRTDLGAKVIVANRYAGLLYRDEIQGELRPGTVLSGYVKGLRPDGKLDVTLHRGGREELGAAKEAILAAFQGTDFLPLHDDSSPEAIRVALGMSKKLFKKAVGGLYKAGLVELEPGGIRRKRS